MTRSRLLHACVTEGIDTTSIQRRGRHVTVGQAKLDCEVRGVGRRKVHRELEPKRDLEAESDVRSNADRQSAYQGYQSIPVKTFP